MGTYIVLELGAVQGLFPIVAAVKIPFMISSATYLYALYLILSQKIDFGSLLTKTFTVLCLFIAIYALFSTKLESRFTNYKIDLIKVFFLFLANYFVVVHSVKKSSQFILLIDIFLISILFASYNAIMQGGKIWGSRWLKDENHISLVAAIAIPYAFMLFRIYKSKIKKIFYLVCLVSYIGVVVVSHSRGGALSMILAGFLCWLFTDKKLRNTIIIVIAVIMVFAYAPPKFFEEMKTLEQGTEEGTAADRIYLWGICFDMFFKYPFLGVGPMNYPVYFSQFDHMNLYPSGYKRPPHTTPLQWMAEMGLIGIFIMFAVQRGLYKNWKLTKYLKQNVTDESDQLYNLLSHGNAIAQVAFWFGSIFLSLMPYPFYWPLIPFSESWKNITEDEIINTAPQE